MKEGTDLINMIQLMSTFSSAITTTMSEMNKTIDNIIKALNSAHDHKIDREMVEAVTKAVEKDGGALIFAQKSFSASLERRMKDYHVHYHKAPCADKEGNVGFLYPKSEEKLMQFAIRKAQGDFYREHNWKGSYPMSILATIENGKLKTIPKLNPEKAFLLKTYLEMQRIPFCLEKTGTEEFRISYGLQNEEAVNRTYIKATADLSDRAGDVLKEQLKYTIKQNKELTQEIGHLIKTGQPSRYLVDLEDNVLKVTPKGLELTQNGATTNIKANCAEFYALASTAVEQMHTPIMLSQEEYEEYKNQTQEQKKEYFLEKSRENNRPQITKKETELLRDAELRSTAAVQKYAPLKEKAFAVPVPYYRDPVMQAMMSQYAGQNAPIQESVMKESVINASSYAVALEKELYYTDNFLEESRADLEKLNSAKNKMRLLSKIASAPQSQEDFYITDTRNNVLKVEKDKIILNGKKFLKSDPKCIPTAKAILEKMDSPFDASAFLYSEMHSSQKQETITKLIIKTAATAHISQADSKCLQELQQKYHNILTFDGKKNDLWTKSFEQNSFIENNDMLKQYEDYLEKHSFEFEASYSEQIDYHEYQKEMDELAKIRESYEQEKEALSYDDDAFERSADAYDARADMDR